MPERIIAVTYYEDLSKILGLEGDELKIQGIKLKPEREEVQLIFDVNPEGKFKDKINCSWSQGADPYKESLLRVKRLLLGDRFLDSDLCKAIDCVNIAIALNPLGEGDVADGLEKAINILKAIRG